MYSASDDIMRFLALPGSGSGSASVIPPREVSAGENRCEIGHRRRCRCLVAHPSSALLRTLGGANVILQNGMCTDQKRGLGGGGEGEGEGGRGGREGRAKGNKTKQNKERSDADPDAKPVERVGVSKRPADR